MSSPLVENIAPGTTIPVEVDELAALAKEARLRELFRAMGSALVAFS